MGNQLDTLEQGLKEALESYKAPYDPSAWESMEMSLDKAASPPTPGNGSASQGGAGKSYRKYILGAAALLLISFGVGYILSGDGTTSKQDGIVATDGSDNAGSSSHAVASKNAGTNNAAVMTGGGQEDEAIGLIDDSDSEEYAEASSMDLAAASSNDRATYDNNMMENAALTDNGMIESDPFAPNMSSSSNSLAVEQSTAQDNNKTASAELATTAASSAPNAAFTMDRSVVCEGEEISFSPNTTGAKRYWWNFRKGAKSSKQEAPTAQFNDAGEYDVRLTITDEMGRQGKASKGITVLKSPTPNFTAESNELEVSFNNTSYADSYTWKFGDGNTSKDKNPTHVFNKGYGIYNVTLVAKNKNGCISQKTEQVRVARYLGGEAQRYQIGWGTWLPEGLEELENGFELTIYNDARRPIFNTKSVEQGWDGVDANQGSVVPEGTYSWVVNITESNGKAMRYDGSLYVTQ